MVLMYNDSDRKEIGSAASIADDILRRDPMAATETKKKKKKKKKNTSTILVVLLMVAGLAVMLYPTLSNIYNEVTGSYAIQEFNENLADRDELELIEERAKAELYNASLVNTGIVTECPYEYKDIMDFGNGMMGYIEIPTVEIYLPIYHGVSENVLSKAVGHIVKSAFPIGGEGNHSVLTGHTGLPSAELFTDLDKVVEGDTFYIYALGETLAYEVDQIVVVLPEEVDDIQPVPGEDYCTLVTCTPYGINSHRLLVRGHRIEYIPEVEVVEPVEQGFDWGTYLPYIGIGLFLLLLLIALVLYLKNRAKKAAAAKSVSAAAEIPAAETPVSEAPVAEEVPVEGKEASETEK